MVKALYYYTEKTFPGLKPEVEPNDLHIVFFARKESHFIEQQGFSQPNIFFIRVDSFYFEGILHSDGFLHYIISTPGFSAWFDANVPVLLSRLKSKPVPGRNLFILSNLMKNDDGNRLVFELFNILGSFTRINGADMVTLSDAVYHGGEFHDSFFIAFGLSQDVVGINYDSFWQDYSDPVIITDAFNGGIRTINWQEAVSFYLDALSGVNWNNVEEVIHNYPLRLKTVKGDSFIARQTVDLQRSITDIYCDHSLFSFQYAFPQRFNHARFHKELKERMLTCDEGELEMVFVSGVLPRFFKREDFSSFRLFPHKILQRLTGPVVNLMVRESGSTPAFTTNSMFTLRLT